MEKLHKAAMIFGLIAMLALGLLLCFVPAKKNELTNNTPQWVLSKEP